MRELMSYLPELYRESPEMVAIQQAIQPELELMWQGRDDLLAQLDPNTATWGLSYWEDALGLTTNTALPVDQRRTRIIARLRGMGTTTVAVIKSVVETFCPGCEVSVIEHYSEYLVEIHLTITDQAVADNDGLRDVLGLIMPAHLAWGFSFTLETVGGIRCGVCSELAGRVEIWPSTVRKITVSGPLIAAAVLEYRGTIEIYPQGGMTNG